MSENLNKPKSELAPVSGSGVGVSEILNRFPEVEWDRWAGKLGIKFDIAVYGWIAREDGRADFVFLRIDEDGPYMFTTSSAKYSADFYRRLNFDSGHQECKRVENHFPSVRATHQSPNHER